MATTPNRDMVPGRRMTGLSAEVERRDQEGAYSATAQLSSQLSPRISDAQATATAAQDDVDAHLLVVTDGGSNTQSAVVEITVTGAATVTPGSAGEVTIDVDAQAVFEDGEVPGGTPDGIVTDFSLAHTPSPATAKAVHVYAGVPPAARGRMAPTSEYTIVNVAGTYYVRFSVAPAVGTGIIVDYRR